MALPARIRDYNSLVTSQNRETAFAGFLPREKPCRNWMNIAAIEFLEVLKRAYFTQYSEQILLCKMISVSFLRTFYYNKYTRLILAFPGYNNSL